MTIYDVKRLHLERFPSSHYFDRKTMRFFGQTLKMFRVSKVDEERYLVEAPVYLDGKRVHTSVRVFNVETRVLL